MINVKFRVLKHGDVSFVPTQATPESAGYDLRAAVPAAEDNDSICIITPGDWALVPTGLALEIPEGYEMQIRPRSGLALKEGITVLNAPGTVDSDYRGEIQVMLYNASDQSYVVERGTRIAQAIFAPVTRVSFSPSEKLTATHRGDGGFGSTGAH